MPQIATLFSFVLLIFSCFFVSNRAMPTSIEWKKRENAIRTPHVFLDPVGNYLYFQHTFLPPTFLEADPQMAIHHQSPGGLILNPEGQWEPRFAASEKKIGKSQFSPSFGKRMSFTPSFGKRVPPAMFQASDLNTRESEKMKRAAASVARRDQFYPSFGKRAPGNFMQNNQADPPFPLMGNR